MNNIEKFSYILILYAYLIFISIGSIFMILVILNLLENLFDFSIFLSEIISFLTFNNDVATLGAYQYLTIIFILFPLSFIVFYLIVEFLRNKRILNFVDEFLNSYSRSLLAVYSINISFFGFLTLFFTLLNIDGQISEKLLYIIAGLTMSTLFPYFYQLVADAKQNEWKSELEIRDDINNKINTKNVSKNKKIDNIYFVLAIAFLFFIFVLIFFMYQKAFDFGEIIDVKTLFTVLGTIFGAYFGAKTAGKYAIESVEKQINAQREIENKKENRNLLRCLYVYSAHTDGIVMLIDEILAELDLQFKGNAVFENLLTFEIITNAVQEQYEILENVDITQVFSDEYFMFIMIKDDLNQVLQVLNDSESNLQNKDFELLQSNIKKMKRILGKLKLHSVNVNTAISKNE